MHGVQCRSSEPVLIVQHACRQLVGPCIRNCQDCQASGDGGEGALNLSFVPFLSVETLQYVPPWLT